MAARYSAASKQQVYRYLAEQAQAMLEAGWSVLVDATFLQAETRQLFRDLAARLAIPFRILHFEARREVLEQRIVERARSGNDASEAGIDVLHAQLRDYVELSDAEQAECWSVAQAEQWLAR